MKKTNIVCFVFVSILANVAFAETVDLVCTGEHQYDVKHEKSPYSFQIKIDLDKELSSIYSDHDPWLGRKASYPEDSLWNKENCPNPYWHMEVTDTVFRVISACSINFYNQFGGTSWELSRINGEFNVFTHNGREAKGLCVKKSERVF